MLDDRVVLIAGATGALGSAIVREFARTQAQLVLTSRCMEKLCRLIGEADLPEERILALWDDVTQVDRVEVLVKDIAVCFGRVDILLNTVGEWSGGKPVAETSVEDWDRMLALNLRSAFLLSRAVLPHMLEARWGRIVHVSPKTAVEPRAREAGYAVSKMGVITLTEVIAAEVKGTGLTANVIVPNTIDTLLNRASMPEADPGKWVLPEHIAARMRFLCSDAAASINGARMAINGAG